MVSIPMRVFQAFQLYLERTSLPTLLCTALPLLSPQLLELITYLALC